MKQIWNSETINSMIAHIEKIEQENTQLQIESSEVSVRTCVSGFGLGIP